eukprot:TRINITY_DN82303_c0_g1_i1.p1 TRINITY_DN82303_c0_g1~~TRINITY_DN82303_c0_g1_i1.p1  ORF type:complete len:242 (+),score=30.86 TRINITY_DN82303_c0_g1_i1:67-792(+)
MSSSTPTKNESETDEELLLAKPSLRSPFLGRGVSLAVGASVVLGVVACVSYAWDRHNVWVAEADNVLGLSHKDSVEWLDLGVGTACRKGAHDKTLIPENGETKTGVGGLNACKAMCQVPTCKGAEYRVSEDRCELWYEQVGGHEHLILENSVQGKPDFVCLLRRPTCTELRGHFSIFMSFVQDLNTYHERHCDDGPTETGKCSMSYAKSVDQAAHDICDAMATTCNEKSCYSDRHVKRAHQ